MIPKSGYRFSACAKPLLTLVCSFDASASEGRSEKIMLKQQAKAKCRFNQNHFALASLIMPDRRGCKAKRRRLQSRAAAVAKPSALWHSLAAVPVMPKLCR
jgi:hypothetical protein